MPDASPFLQGLTKAILAAPGWEAAVATYRNGMELFSISPCHAALDTLLWKCGCSLKAASFAFEVVHQEANLEPSPRAVAMMLATCLHHRSLKAAQPVAERAKAIAERDVELQASLIQYYCALGDWKRAVGTLYRRSPPQGPADRAVFHAVRALGMAGRWEYAIRIAKKYRPLSITGPKCRSDDKLNGALMMASSKADVSVTLSLWRARQSATDAPPLLRQVIALCYAMRGTPHWQVAHRIAMDHLARCSYNKRFLAIPLVRLLDGAEIWQGGEAPPLPVTVFLRWAREMKYASAAFFSAFRPANVLNTSIPALLHHVPGAVPVTTLVLDTNVLLGVAFSKTKRDSLHRLAAESYPRSRLWVPFTAFREAVAVIRKKLRMPLTKRKLRWRALLSTLAEENMSVVSLLQEFPSRVFLPRITLSNSDPASHPVNTLLRVAENPDDNLLAFVMYLGYCEGTGAMSLSEEQRHMKSLMTERRPVSTTHVTEGHSCVVLLSNDRVLQQRAMNLGLRTASVTSQCDKEEELVAVVP